MAEAKPGGDDPFGPEPSPRDLQLIERALRAHWPIAPATQVRLVRAAAAAALRHRDHPRKLATAMRVVLMAQRNQLLQERLDLDRARFEAKGKPSEGFSLARLVAEAEAIATGYTPAERPDGG